MVVVMVNGKAGLSEIPVSGVTVPKPRGGRTMKAATKPSAAASVVVIPGIGIRNVVIRVIGDTPFISHAWSQKAVQMIKDKQAKKAVAGRETRDPQADYLSSMYRDEKGIPYIPALMFKSAAVGACTQLDNMTKTYARGAFHINLEDPRVYFTNAVKPEMREDMVRVGMGVADVRYRAQFWPWEVDLRVRFNERAISEEQIANLLNVAGFAVGIGEWRPEKDGQFGMFHVGNATG